ncbi:hypothetical protein Tco_1431645 [Tanacetum coccineum]
MCFVLLCITGFTESLIVELLSQRMSTVFIFFPHNSSINPINHTQWQAQLVAATYSASVDERGGDACGMDVMIKSTWQASSSTPPQSSSNSSSRSSSQGARGNVLKMKNAMLLQTLEVT